MGNRYNWGMGTNIDKDGLYICYGFPICDDPNLFEPDPEMCSEEELNNHKKALAKRNK